MNRHSDWELLQKALDSSRKEAVTLQQKGLLPGQRGVSKVPIDVDRLVEDIARSVRGSTGPAVLSGGCSSYMLPKPLEIKKSEDDDSE